MLMRIGRTRKKTWGPAEKMCTEKGISCEISYPLVKTMASNGDDDDSEVEGVT